MPAYRFNQSKWGPCFVRAPDWQRNASAWYGGLATRHSQATKYMSGVRGFCSPSMAGLRTTADDYQADGTMSPYLTYPGNVSYAAMVAHWELWGTRTDIVYCPNDGFRGLNDFTKVSSLSGAGSCAQTSESGAAIGYNPTLFNEDTPKLNGGPAYTIGTPSGPDAVVGWSDTHVEWNEYDFYGTKTGWCQSTLTNARDLQAIYTAALTDFLGHSWSLDFTSHSWAMTWHDAPQIAGTNADTSSLTPSAYDGAAAVANNDGLGIWNIGGGVGGSGHSLWGVSCISGWLVSLWYEFYLIRGQVRNLSAIPVNYWIGRYREAFEPSGTYATGIINIVDDSAGLKLNPYGTTGDTVECPYVTDLAHPTVNAPFPVVNQGGKMKAADFYFIVVGVTPAAWAAANGYTIT